MDEVTADPPEDPPERPAPAGPAPAPLTGPASGDTSVCAVELPEFEGPLDLLLHLVRRHELDILDIPIAFVCEKYLEYIEFMRAMDLEVAGDYLVMAATLAYLKSRELVPSDPLEVEEPELEEGPDPREELIARLLEYQTFRDAASQLDAMPMAGRDTFARGQTVDLPPVDAGLAPITLFRLAEAYHRVLDKARILKSHEVVFEKVSVSSRMQQLTVLLLERDSFDFEQIFLERSWSSESELRGMLVVTLMSILELVRLGIARVHQTLESTTLLVHRHASAEEAQQALAGYDEAASFGLPTAAKSEAEGDDDDDALGDDTDPESFGDDADPESFGDDADPESFGDDMDPESFGDDMDSESFGDDVDPESSGDDADDPLGFAAGFADAAADPEPPEIATDSRPFEDPAIHAEPASEPLASDAAMTQDAADVPADDAPDDPPTDG